MQNFYPYFGNKKNLYFNLYIYTYILSYIAGPAVINIFLFLTGFFILYRNIYEKNKLIFLEYVFIIFFVYIFFKDLINNQIDLHLLILLNFINIFIYFRNLFNTDNFYLHISPLFLIIVPVLIDSLIQYFVGYNIFGFPKFDYYRLTSFFKNEPIVGSFLMKFLIPLLIFYLYLNNNSTKKIIYLFVSILSFVVIILSGERLALIQSSFAFLILLIYFFYKKSFSKNILLIFVTIFIALFFSINDVIKKRLYDTNMEFIYLFKNLNSIDIDKLGSLKNYFYNFKSGFEYWEHNKIFGGGYRSYNKYCSIKLQNSDYATGCSTHPHNIYIETLADHGLFGLLLFTVFLILIIQKNIFYQNGFNLVLIMMIFPFFPSQSFYSSYYNSIFLLILVLSFLKKTNIKF